MRKESENHIETTLNSRIQPIFQRATERIESLKVGERIAATTLAEEIAPEFGMKWQALYAILKLLFDQGFPGFKISRGSKGGVERLPFEEEKSE